VEKKTGLTPDELEAAKRASAETQEDLRNRAVVDPGPRVIRDDDGVPRDDVDHKVRIEIKKSTPYRDMASWCGVALAEEGSTWERAGQLVRIVIASPTQELDSRWVDTRGRERFSVRTGQPSIDALCEAQLTCLLDHAIHWVKKPRPTKNDRDPEPVKDHPDGKVVKIVHTAKTWPPLSRLVGLARAPFLRPDGTICQVDGYDAKTGVFLALSPELASDDAPMVPDAPTKAEAEAAYALLSEVFADFPYSSPAEYSVPIAAILTILARAAIDGSVPGFAFDSSKGGEGKTLQTDAISVIATGDPASRSSYSADEEEVRKVIDGFALEGRPVICLDDCKHALGGATLDLYSTARDTVTVRKLGESDPHTVPWRSILMFTGVALETKGQMARRIVWARVQSGEVRPQDRTGFRIEGDLLDHCRERRPTLICAALTILRAYFAHGCLGRERYTWGSFQQWAEIVPAAIAFAGGPNVLDCRRQVESEVNPDIEALTTVLAELPTLCARYGGVIRATELTTELFAHEPTDDLRPLADALRELCHMPGHAKPSSVKVSRTLGLHKGATYFVGDYRARLACQPDRDRLRQWYVEVVK
jgi:hypothetical protein